MVALDQPPRFASLGQGGRGVTGFNPEGLNASKNKEKKPCRMPNQN
jgi:hypothetical protein